MIGGTFSDDSDLRGLDIFTVESLEAARALTQADPAIQSGRLAFEFHPWLAADALQLGVPKHLL